MNKVLNKSYGFIVLLDNGNCAPASILSASSTLGSSLGSEIGFLSSRLL